MIVKDEVERERETDLLLLLVDASYDFLFENILFSIALSFILVYGVEYIYLGLYCCISVAMPIAQPPTPILYLALITYVISFLLISY